MEEPSLAFKIHLKKSRQRHIGRIIAAIIIPLIFIIILFGLITIYLVNPTLIQQQFFSITKYAQLEFVKENNDERALVLIGGYGNNGSVFYDLEILDKDYCSALPRFLPKPESNDSIYVGGISSSSEILGICRIDRSINVTKCFSYIGDSWEDSKSTILNFSTSFPHSTSLMSFQWRDSLFFGGGPTQNDYSFFHYHINISKIEKCSTQNMKFSFQSCFVSLDNIVVVSGGLQNSSVSDEVFFIKMKTICDQNEMEWMPKLNTPRMLHGCTHLQVGNSTVILVAGGLNKESQPLASVEMLRLNENSKWHYLPPLLKPRSHSPSLNIFKQHLIVTGGKNKRGKALKSTEVFDEHNQVWSKTTKKKWNLKSKRFGHITSLISKKLCDYNDLSSFVFSP